MRAPRVSLRWQLGLWAVIVSLIFAALAFTIATPVLFSAAARTRADDLLPLLGGLLLLAAVILALVIYALLLRLVARPTERLLDATERIGTVGGDPPLLGSTGPILGRLGTAFERMSRRLEAEQRRTGAQLEELHRLNAELANARDAMVRHETLVTVGRLSAGVAHEIGNPLAAILGYVNVLRQQSHDLTVRECIGRMEREARRIDRIVRDLLEFARPPVAGGETREVDPAVVSKEALRMLQQQKRFSLVEIVDELPGELPLVRADEHALRQILVNLLLNAADAMDGRGQVRVWAESTEEHVRILVHDAGEGIAPEALERLFAPFFTTKAPGSGTGLGLAICYGLAQRMGGRLTAANHPEGGAVLELDLRRVVPPSSESSRDSITARS